MTSDIELNLPEGVTLDVTELSVPDDLDYDLWRVIGLKLASAHVCTQWALGDWWAHGERRYANRSDFKRLAKEIGYTAGSLMNLGTVSRKVAPSLRNEALSWSHHAAVAMLSPEEQRKWLNEAASSKCSVRQLRQLIRKQNADRHPGVKPQGRAKIWSAEIRRKAQAALQIDSPDLSNYAGQVDNVDELLATARQVAEAWEKLASYLEQLKRPPPKRSTIKRLRLEDTHSR